MEISMANVISDETIEYVGILAKLELSDEEKEAAKKDMGRMLDYIDKLGELEEKNDRHARFRTVIALIEKGREHLFEGVVEGEITASRQGTEGFGYDPVFAPEGLSETFAQLGSDIKNSMSHRARAAEALARYLAGE